MKIIDIDNKNSLQNAARIIKKGGILVFPTDTVYGIGCLMNDPGIRRLYEIKNRPLSQPTGVLMTRCVYSYCSSNESPRIISDNIRKDFYRGRVTLILKVSLFNIRFPKIILKDKKIGIRLPQYPWLKKLIDMAGPIVASSANKKGVSPPVKFKEIDQDIIEQADLTIKTDDKILGKPSRVYDLESKKYLR